jgi:hypothetical protein
VRLGGVPDAKNFEGLDKSKTIVLNGEDRDVFDDGTVVVKSTPGTYAGAPVPRAMRDTPHRPAGRRSALRPSCVQRSGRWFVPGADRSV